MTLWRSPTLRTMLMYGAAGAGFAIANLILARVLPTAEYALFTLAIALGNVGFSLAPLGIDDVVNRRPLEAGPALFRRVLAAAISVGILIGAIGGLAYEEISPTMALMVGLSTAAGGVMMVAAGQFQSEQRFGRSQALIQSANIVLFLAAVLTLVWHWREAWPAVLVSTAGFVVAGAMGWRWLFRERHAKAARSSTFAWPEALALAGINAAGLLLVQLERLVLPYVLPMEALATFGVLAAIAGSIFRVLQMGVGYALIPRLRAADSVHARRRLLAHEALLAGTIAAVGAVGIIALTPFVEQHVLAGKYHLATPLLVATIVSGIAKLLNAFAKAAVTALADPREVAALNVLGWLSVAVGIGAAVFGARWGLTGVIYGVGLGWLVRAVSAFYVTARHLRVEQDTRPHRD